jgi:RNA recognition motif-containing protein
MTLLILNLPMKANEKELYQFFKVRIPGKIRDIRIIKDPKTGRSKGLAYLEFYDQDSLLRALALSGTEFNKTGINLRIQTSQAEINRAYIASKQYKITRSGNNDDEKELYAGKVFIDGLVGALGDIQENDLKELFNPFGEIDFIDLRRDPASGKCKGYALIQYKQPSDAHAAIKAMNNFVINDITIKVADHPHGSMIGQNLKTTQQSLGKTSVSNNNPKNTVKDLDYEESGGFLHNAQSRFLLMQKLTRENDMSSINSCTSTMLNQETSSKNDETSQNTEESPSSAGTFKTGAVNNNNNVSNDAKYIKYDDIYSGAPVIQTATGLKKVIPEANIYVKNLDLSLTIKQLESVFSIYGNILSCKIATDASGNSLGYGYVQFDRKDSADRAITQANNTKLKDLIIQVQPFVSKSNRVDPKNNLYIKNLPNNISEEELQAKLIEMFGRFGTISSTVVRFDKTAGRPFGFICFEDHTSADSAIKTLQGKDPFGVGLGLYIGWAEKKPERVKRLTEMHNQNALQNNTGYSAINASGM